MIIDKNSTSTYVMGWLGAAAFAVVLAAASPSESSVMGYLPAFMSRTLAREPVVVPQGLPSDRTLALVTFGRAQRPQAESWIQGLNLNHDSSIAWMRMPVLNDPGTPGGRDAAETRLLQSYPAPAERARLVPVFMDRAAFVRAAGLNGVDQFYAVVVNRRGEVLAKVEGQYDADKAQTLRETLNAHDL
ncbi:MAG: hypothetical protein JWQ72_549 [Polaromonas sp.]|nr:hypothetical protein [Polaromonas sp.]